MVSIPDLTTPGFPGLIPDTDSSGGTGGKGILSSDAQQLALLYEAALNRTADLSGLNFWIDQFEAGKSLRDIALYFVGSPEFVSAFGNPSTLSNQALVDVFYKNVLDRPGETGGVKFWVGQLDGGEARQDVLIQFAVSDENRSASKYVGTLHDDGSGHWLF